MPNVSFSSINVLNGNELGDTPQVSLQTSGKKTTRGSETLLIFLDFPTASPSTCADLARTLSDGYSRSPGGMTSALRLAVKLANDRAIQLNKGAPPAARLEGSISCALITPETVVIAQAGPALAFARANTGAFETIAPYGEGSTQLVGMTTAIDVHFNNFSPQPGDVFVLTGTRSYLDVSDTLVNVCMGKGDARMVAGYLNANIKQGRMMGVAISVDGANAPAAAAPAPRAATPQAEPASMPAAATAATVAASTVTKSSSTVASDISASVSHAGESMKAGVSQATKSIQRSLSSFGGKLLPEESPVEVAQRSKATTFILAAIAIILPILIGVIVGVLYFQFSGEAERLQARSNALAAVEAVKATNDPAQVKVGWAKALQLIDEYETKNPDDRATFVDARTAARAQLDQISQVTRVSTTALAQFDTTAPRQIAASSLGIYTLDMSANTGEYYVLNPERNAVAGKKVQITFGDGLTATAKLSDVAWATTTGDRWRTEGAVFFSNGDIWEYSSATGRAAPIKIPVDADATPGTVKSGVLYNNSVYLLDTGVGQVWRYPLAGDVLGTGNSYFRSPYRPLQESVDMAIDGAVYVLQQNGAVLKYFGRQPVQFNIAGLPEQLIRVAAIAVSGDDPNRGSVFVLDAGAGSVIELSKTGQFIRQYRGNGDEWVNAIDMSLDPTSNTMYVATQDRLFSFAVQPPPPPPATPEVTPTTAP
jgi:sugar lactone lactonase YvrE